jgi:small nuclear ribonucleoprotein (snRNP)-like protein
MSHPPESPIASIATPPPPADQASPLAYVQFFIGKTLLVLLNDGFRLYRGVFAAIDWMGMMAFSDATELTEDHERDIGRMFIPLQQVQAIEWLP